MMIVSPKTNSRTIQQFTEFLGAKKGGVDFWHSNFRDAYYFAQIGKVPVHLLFCGYGEGTAAHAISHGYEMFIRENDACPGVLYFGACFASALSDINLGEIIIPNQSHSDSEITREIQAKSENVSDDFDPTLTGLLLSSAQELNIPHVSGKILCKESYERDFWFPFASEWGPQQGYIAGEVESAACLAACHARNISCAAILDVKDKLSTTGEYEVRGDEERNKAFANILAVVKRTIDKLNERQIG